jgi:hypothetical protein
MSRYELGIHPGVRGPAYIALGDEPQPLDQTDLNMWTRLTFNVGSNSHRKEKPTGGTHLAAARAILTPARAQNLLDLSFLVVPSGVFWNVLVHLSD